MDSSRTLVHARRAPGGRRSIDATAGEALVLERYRLLERLGAGGFGVVWRAHDELLHREVAVKRIPLPPGGEGERASREALASARLSHPAIVALYEACAVEGAFFLISEMVHGRTLAALIADGALDDEQVLEIGVALAGALSHAHARGVIHRDVKPHNVLVPDRPAEGADGSRRPPSVAKLTDFGGARLHGEDVLTRTGETLGTLAYMSPEQSEGREAGEAADLYSLALVLYEALCGVNPVRGATPAATVRRIGRPIEPLGRRRRDLPRSLTRGLDRALAPRSSDRGTLGQLRAELEAALAARAPRARRGWRRQAAEGDARGHGLASAGAPAWDPRPERASRRREEGPRQFGWARARREAAPAWRRGAAAARGPAPAWHDDPPAREQAPPPHQPAPPREQVRERPARGIPGRRLWIASAFAVIVWQAWVGRPGVALLMLAALAPVLVISRGSDGGWLAAALAPALGLLGLAGAYPALAGQASQARKRALLGALGYWWLILCEALLASRLWLGQAPGTPPRGVWEGSLGSAATHVIAPALSAGVLFGAALWAAGAVALPWIVRGRSAALDLVGATMWCAAIAVAEPRLDAGLHSGSVDPSPRGMVLGAVLGGVLAVAARALWGPV